MKIVIAQYLAGPDGEYLDDAISLWTKPYNWDTPPYSHTEIGFPYSDELAVWVANHQEPPFNLMAPYEYIYFSSTLRDGRDGTRFATSGDILKHPMRWDLYTREYTVEEYKVLFTRATSIHNRPYFKSGIFLDFFLPLDTIGHIAGDFVNKWYCSQACWYVLTGKRDRVSPRRITKRILKMGFKKA